jgi:hypothetical protein
MACLPLSGGAKHEKRRSARLPGDYGCEKNAWPAGPCVNAGDFRSLISRWHPDTCRGDSRKCEEMTKKILDAQKIIMAYCAQYTYAFTEQEIKKYLSDDEWWEARFGNDPVWGKGTASKDDR